MSIAVVNEEIPGGGSCSTWDQGYYIEVYKFRNA